MTSASPTQAPGVETGWEDSPIAWMSRLVLAVDKGTFGTAAEAQRELKRLGWRVDRCVDEDEPVRRRRRA